jgi:hypothetical protein
MVASVTLKNDLTYRMRDLDGKMIMELKDKPSLHDIIQNVETGLFYKVIAVDISSRTCIARSAAYRF